MTLRYLSVCSGIEAATVAWHPLGWEAAAFSEIETFPRALLTHRYPEVPLHGDFTTIKGSEYGAIDLLVGGTPCQSFSVAGKRLGLDDPRGNLAIEFLSLAMRCRARWVVWENVPGVLSSWSDETDCLEEHEPQPGRSAIRQRNDFDSFLSLLGQCGYGFAWRVLDAQHFGVPQRRRRVFVVGYIGDWRRAAAVLFERESLRGDITPRREARESVAGSLTSRASGGGGGPGAGTDEAAAGYLQPVTHTLRAEGFDASEDGTGRGIPLVAGCLQERDGKGADSDTKPGHLIPVVMPTLDGRSGRSGANTFAVSGGVVPTIAPNEPFLYKGLQEGELSNASTQERNTREILQLLRTEVGEEAFAKWGFGILDSFQHKKVLQSGLYGDGVRPKASERESRMDDGALPCPKNMPTGELREMWERGQNGCSSYRFQLAQQLAKEFGKALPQLPLESTQGVAVRRLTPRECERLMGFPDDYTLFHSKSGKPCGDSGRYKALGNSMAVPVMRWIGERIDQVERL